MVNKTIAAQIWNVCLREDFNGGIMKSAKIPRNKIQGQTIHFLFRTGRGTHLYPSAVITSMKITHEYAITAIAGRLYFAPVKLLVIKQMPGSVS